MRRSQNNPLMTSKVTPIAKRIVRPFISAPWPLLMSFSSCVSRPSYWFTHAYRDDFVHRNTRRSHRGITPPRGRVLEVNPVRGAHDPLSASSLTGNGAPTARSSTGG
jgi:hypothetical protein